MSAPPDRRSRPRRACTAACDQVVAQRASVRSSGTRPFATWAAALLLAGELPGGARHCRSFSAKRGTCSCARRAPRRLPDNGPRPASTSATGQRGFGLRPDRQCRCDRRAWNKTCQSADDGSTAANASARGMPLRCCLRTARLTFPEPDVPGLLSARRRRRPEEDARGVSRVLRLLACCCGRASCRRRACGGALDMLSEDLGRPSFSHEVADSWHASSARKSGLWARARANVSGLGLRLAAFQQWKVESARCHRA